MYELGQAASLPAFSLRAIFAGGQQVEPSPTCISDMHLMGLGDGLSLKLYLAWLGYKKWFSPSGPIRGLCFPISRCFIPYWFLAGSIPFKMILTLALPLETPAGAAPAVPLPPAKCEPLFHPRPSLPVWPLKAWWLKTVSLADPGVIPSPGKGSSWSRQDAPAAFSCLLAHRPHWPHWARLPLRDRMSKALSCVILSDAQVHCSLNRVWRKN